MRSGTADARPRITSEIGTSMRYPSYLERGPDYEAEMRYFSGDSLMSPRVGFVPFKSHRSVNIKKYCTPCQYMLNLML